MLVLAIDVGIVNLGVAVLETTTGKFEHVGKVSLFPRLKALKKESELLHRIHELALDPFDPGLGKWASKASVVLIEQQMRRKMLIIQYILGSVFKMMNKEVKFIAPQRVKNVFGLSRGQHSANKRAAIDFIQGRYPQIMQILA